MTLICFIIYYWIMGNARVILLCVHLLCACEHFIEQTCSLLTLPSFLWDRIRVERVFFSPKDIRPLFQISDRILFSSLQDIGYGYPASLTYIECLTIMPDMSPCIWANHPVSGHAFRIALKCSQIKSIN